MMRGPMNVKFVFILHSLGLSNYDVNKVSYHYQISCSGLLGCTLAWAVRYLLHPMEAQVQSQGRSYRSYGICDTEWKWGRFLSKTFSSSCRSFHHQCSILFCYPRVVL